MKAYLRGRHQRSQCIKFVSGSKGWEGPAGLRADACTCTYENGLQASVWSELTVRGMSHRGFHSVVTPANPRDEYSHTWEYPRPQLPTLRPHKHYPSTLYNPSTTAGGDLTHYIRAKENSRRFQANVLPHIRQLHDIEHELYIYLVETVRTRLKSGHKANAPLTTRTDRLKSNYRTGS